jgi:hypothetical protein
MKIIKFSHYDIIPHNIICMDEVSFRPVNHKWGFDITFIGGKNLTVDFKSKNEAEKYRDQLVNLIKEI